MNNSLKLDLLPTVISGGKASFTSESLDAGTNEAVKFLKAMHGNRNVHLASISFNGTIEAKSFASDDCEGYRAWISARQGRTNLYFAVNQMRSTLRDRKGGKSDVAFGHYLHADIDDVEAFERITAMTPKPTVLVSTGGGFQLFWHLREPSTDLASIELHNKRLSQELGGDHCFNIDRLMRIAGTVNVLNPKKAKSGRRPTITRVIEEETDWSRSYSLTEFGQVSVCSSHAVDLRDGTNFAPFDLSELSASISDGTRVLILDGDDVSIPIGSAGARYPSRSEVVFRVTCDLARAGVPHHEIIGVLINPKYGVSASILEKQRPIEYAARQVSSALDAIASDWPDHLKNGRIASTYQNTRLAIRRLGLHASYDIFSNRKRLGGHALQSYAGELTDNGCAALRSLILKEYGFDPGKEHTYEAANALCVENPYHPIRDYLSRLSWDGIPRIETWLIKYCGADDTPLNREIGRLFLIAAVRRIMKPGSKFDTILILEGNQGKGKSTALEILAGAGNFSDQEILTLDAKSQAEALEGKWIYELAELEGIGRADTAKVKAFASRSTDRARPVYGRFREDRPRQVVFVGTTNDSKYLRDMTGNRRFWPVRTAEIDLEGLIRDRDQIWAEAAMVEAAGMSIVLAKELWGDAQCAQDQRMEDDPWYDLLSDVQGDQTGEYERVSSEELLTSILQIPPDRQYSSASKRLAQVMGKLGWSGPKLLRMKNSVPKRGYERRLSSS